MLSKIACNQESLDYTAFNFFSGPFFVKIWLLLFFSFLKATPILAKLVRKFLVQPLELALPKRQPGRPEPGGNSTKTKVSSDGRSPGWTVNCNFLHTFFPLWSCSNYFFLFFKQKFSVKAKYCILSWILELYFFFLISFIIASSHLTGNRCIVDSALCDHR